MASDIAFHTWLITILLHAHYHLSYVEPTDSLIREHDPKPRTTESKDSLGPNTVWAPRVS